MIKPIYITPLFKRTYPRSRKELIKEKVNTESLWSPWYKAPALPKYQKEKLHFTHASIAGFAGNIIKGVRSCLP